MDTFGRKSTSSLRFGQKMPAISMTLGGKLKPSAHKKHEHSPDKEPEKISPLERR
jgi:hypothetical protein